MAIRRVEPKGLRQHRSYTIDEAARAIRVCKATVRRWIRTGLIAPIDTKRPIMLAGADLVTLTRSSTKTKQKCKQDEAYCLACRAPRQMAFQEAEIISANASGANLRALCGVCVTVMHKRVSLNAFPALTSILHLSATQAHRHLIETSQPRSNEHFAHPSHTPMTDTPALGQGAVKSLAVCSPVSVGSSDNNANTVFQPDLFQSFKDSN
jgi:Helix-turn-helix domain